MVCADLTEQATLRGFNAATPKLDIREFWKLRELARKLGELGTAFDQGPGTRLWAGRAWSAVSDRLIRAGKGGLRLRLRLSACVCAVDVFVVWIWQRLVGLQPGVI